ncbi:hypothetical protein ASD36_22045 [Rhizobium sp. Root1334]|nr:hypothetical protein ASD36_22045 [Rhizobium sp. Root1334]
MQMGAILRGRCDWKQSIDGQMTEVGVAICKLAIKPLIMPPDLRTALCPGTGTIRLSKCWKVGSSVSEHRGSPAATRCALDATAAIWD